ncbi:heme NO-binding domain-containing protein [Photobacterium angustum]|uniref:heme NO-binding domain-containing protein n=1 Tax=Photobacterium angustum TaxID=661 RepID=UPI000A9BF989|nr:heme NO-binding domain-containing protein [Photobacterium angustum]
MKGIIFTEFLDIVERTFDLEVCQSMLDMADDPGVYTSVGSYEHQRLVKLIICLHKVTGVSPESFNKRLAALFSPVYSLYYPTMILPIPTPLILFAVWSHTYTKK